MKFKPLLRNGAAGLMLLLAACTSAPEAQAPALYAGDAVVSGTALRELVEPVFADDAGDAMGETRALLVLHDGRIVAERYAAGFGPEDRHLSWSVAKTVTALLVGVMVSDGRLSLDDPVPVPAWQHGADPRGAITLRQMLNMASGIMHKEQEGPLEQTDALRMLVGDGASDMARYAESKPLAHAPGAAFQYNSATTLILADMMTRLLTNSDDPRARRDAMTRFIQQRFAEPVGIGSLVPEYDARGTLIAGAFMHMTARDYAKIGELIRHRGLARGRQIVSQRWIKFMTTPSPHREGYGGHLWLNRPGAERHLFVGEAPRDVVAAVGLRGQYVIVAPAQRLTIVRLGVTSDKQMPALRDALARIIRRYSKG